MAKTADTRQAPFMMPVAERDWQPSGHPWLIAVVVTVAAFMEFLDTTIVNVSLPHIAGSMSSSYDDATWTLTSYLVANGIAIPVSGSFSRILGRKRYFVTCIALFSLFSFLCGIARDLPELILFRLMQGFFGGGLQPSQQAIILDTFPPEQRGRAFSVAAVATIFAPVIGPALGGWLTDTYGWRWIFFINVPVGVSAILLVVALVEDPPWFGHDRESWHDLDWIGIALIATGFGCLQVMMDRGEDAGWFGSTFICSMAAGATLGLLSATAWLLMSKRPVVSLRPFSDRNFAVGSVVVIAMFAILYAGTVLLPQLAQTRFGYTATWAGLILSPGGFVVLPLIVAVSWLMASVETRHIIAFGFLSLGCAFAFATRLTPDLSFSHMVLLRLAQTASLAFLFVPSSTITYSTLPREWNSDASSLYVMFRNVSGSIGISLGTAAVIERSQVHQAYLSRWLDPFNQNYLQSLNSVRQALQSRGVPSLGRDALAQGLMNRALATQSAILGYEDVFLAISVLAFCMVPLAFLFRSGTNRSGGAPAH